MKEAGLLRSLRRERVFSAGEASEVNFRDFWGFNDVVVDRLLEGVEKRRARALVEEGV